MRELITEALAKFEEKVLELKQLEYIKFHHANLPRARADTQPIKDQIEALRQSIIEFAVAPASQTNHSNLEAACEDVSDISFAQVQVNKG